jgi:polysaccharide pyruvyl transferase WcaK-like protein
MSPSQIVRLYAEPQVVVGMRGHAQMIPFGCGNPIVSLASHDKLWFFLDDIGARDLGVEVGAPDVEEQLAATVTGVLGDFGAARDRIARAREQLWDVTVENLEIVRRGLGRDAWHLMATDERTVEV